MKGNPAQALPAERRAVGLAEVAESPSRLATPSDALDTHLRPPPQLPLLAQAPFRSPRKD